MGGTSTFLALLCMIGFLAAAWGASKIGRFVGLPAFFLEIGIGIVLGPQVGRLIGHEYAVCTSRNFKACELPLNIDELIRTGEPLGATFGQIANMEYCPKELYDQDAARFRRYKKALDEEGNGRPKNRRQLKEAEAMSFREQAEAMERSKVRAPATTTKRHHHHHHNITNATNVTLFSPYATCLQRSCEQDYAKRCADNPDLFTLIGHAGVGLVMFEGSLLFSVEKLKRGGLAAIYVTLISAIITFLTGFGLAAIYGRPLVPDAVMVGTAILPTSVGGALLLLKDVGFQNTQAADIVGAAAFYDDVLALLLFDIFFALGGEFEGFKMVASPIIGICLVPCAVLAGHYVWPYVLNSFLMPQAARCDKGEKVPLSDQVMYFVMFGILVFWAWIMWMLGAFLWGCLLAGLSFACLHAPEQVRTTWEHQTRSLRTWLVRVFFACGIGFAIPVDVMFTGEAFWKGVIMGLGPCILGKVVAAVIHAESRFVVGWTMVVRAELAFFIAQAAFIGGVFSPMAFSITLWALAWAAFVAPYVVRLIMSMDASWGSRLQQVTFGRVVTGEAPAPAVVGLGIDVDASASKEDTDIPTSPAQDTHTGAGKLRHFFRQMVPKRA